MMTVWAGPLAAGAAAQVPLSKEPRHTVVYENADLRILDGETTLAMGAVRSTRLSGEKGVG